MIESNEKLDQKLKKLMCIKEGSLLLAGLDLSLSESRWFRL